MKAIMNSIAIVSSETGALSSESEFEDSDSGTRALSSESESDESDSGRDATQEEMVRRHNLGLPPTYQWPGRDAPEEEMVRRHILELTKLAGEWRAMADYLTRNAVEGRGVSRASLGVLADSANASVRMLHQIQLDSKAMQSVGKKCQCNPDLLLQNG